MVTQRAAAKKSLVSTGRIEEPWPVSVHRPKPPTKLTPPSLRNSRTTLATPDRETFGLSRGAKQTQRDLPVQPPNVKI